MSNDTDRLRYIADDPEIFRFLYDIMSSPEVQRSGQVALNVLRDTIDQQMFFDATDG